MTPTDRCVTPSLLPPMCFCGVGLSSVQVSPSRHPSSLAPRTPPCWFMQCGVWVSGMLWPPPPGLCIPPPSACVLVLSLLVGLVVGFRVAWLVLGLFGWLLVDWFLDNCVWLAGWLDGWLVGSLQGWLVAG